MFPNKIALTDEYIDLIVKERKKHGITAYNLSQKIGKNKSWLTNLENHRTKNISKTDFLLIFKDFAKEENLDVEKYIIKYLHPNAIVTLENGNTIPCYVLQTYYELLSIDGNYIDYMESLDFYNFYNGELDFKKDMKSLEGSLSSFKETVLKKTSELPDKKQRKEIIKAIDIITENLMREFPLAMEYYKIDIFKNIPNNIYGKLDDLYINEANEIINQTLQQFTLLNAKIDVYSYLSEDGDNYSLVSEIANFEYGTLDDLSNIIDKIEAFSFSIYNYIDLSYKFGSSSNIDVKKLYRKLKTFLCAFVNIAKLNFEVIFAVPSNDSSEDIIKETQLQANNLIFQIKQAFQEKYHYSTNNNSLPE
ncbi:MAG: hypothetical protein KHZ01_05365 [Lachnospiraceae bacterium]|nr:hypothetical protein [Lachnospiraceae bacterium]